MGRTEYASLAASGDQRTKLFLKENPVQVRTVAVKDECKGTAAVCSDETARLCPNSTK